MKNWFDRISREIGRDMIPVLLLIALLLMLGAAMAGYLLVMLAKGIF